MVEIIDFKKPLNQIRPQLLKYLSSISAKIDGRSYQRFKESFGHRMKDKVAPARRIAIMKESYEGLQTLVAQPASTKKIVTKHLVTELKERKTKAVTKAVSKIQEAFHHAIIAKTNIASTAFKGYTLKVTSAATHVGKKVGEKAHSRDGEEWSQVDENKTEDDC